MAKQREGSAVKKGVALAVDLIARGGLLFFLILIVIFFTLRSPYFFGVQNFLNILKSVSVIGITAAGIMLIIISGGIDLSTGAQMAFIGCFIAEILLENQSIPWWLGMILSCLVGRQR